MRVILEENKELLTLNLSKEVSGNYWIRDSKKDNLVNIEAIDNKWILKSNNEIKILKNINYKENEILTNVNQVDKIELANFLTFYIYELSSKIIRKIYVLPTCDETIKQLVIDFSKIQSITIGNDKKSMLNYSNNNFIDKQIEISFENNMCKIKNNNIKVNMYINNVLEVEKYISSGDMVFIEGLMFTIIGNILLINNPNNLLFYDSLKFAKRILPENPNKDYTSEQENFVEAFNKSEYFQRPPRFRRSIEEKEFKVDPPPQSNLRNNEMPLIYTLGPMILMGTTSLMSGITAVMNVISGNASFKENAPSIITTITMMSSMLVFPMLQKHWNKSNQKKLEKKRRRKYKNYIDEKRSQILQEIEIQKQILIENNVDLIGVSNVILNKQRTLWDRKIDHSDFLNVRLGIGNVKPKIKVNIPEESFTMDEDDLKDLQSELFNSIKDIEGVPVTIDLAQNRLVGLVGEYSFAKKFIDGIILQLLAYHSYDMLKIVVISSREKVNTWEKYKNLPHFWNNSKTFRFIGIDSDDINKVSNTLVQKLNERLSLLGDKNNNIDDVLYKRFKEYYLIISDEVDYLKNTSIFNELLKVDENLGFSLLVVTDKLDRLPNECSMFINVEPNNSGIFENELVSTNQRTFIPDIPNFNMNLCYLTLCNIPVDIAAGKFDLPKTYSFLEMYDVGSVKQLNILNRWKNNNVIQSLAAPVGINEQGELFKIDLHEKAHGPHGLVAGMTGSGKSEWIITYILSMCVNYHPDEVQFVLIDYKGGGLAGTFENKETGIRIPHLAGTITNLDVSEINRSLASINSELKRRQSLFNSARDKLGESSVDIYKYQKWYREGKISEPISHLFIISDEFAELKSQQPEFMAELISTARIGRSLGVHLILATQKPSGVVDDQIWSNSKFRVCLKVQDRGDSNDMIRVPDAAMLKETGRFYFQVGYNEFFAKGQSAYAGTPYYESDKHKKMVDTDIVFLDNVGESYKDINSDKKIVSAVYKGEELPNILKEIINVANTTETHVRKLWLDAIPEHIYIDKLLQKYEYKKENYILNPIIGEYDAPQYQRQGLLTLPLTNIGNTLIYGISGSGKEKLLTTMLYSLMITHFYQEVNVYVLDFGAEVLNCFKYASIVGDIITQNDEDKIRNYFKLILSEFENRKVLLQDYNGDYLNFIRKSGKSLPTILTIINNFENYSELIGERYDDILVKLTREAEKYGILFVITSNTHNSVKYKISQNFKQAICLEMKDIHDYKIILGNSSNIVPATKKGRGVVKVNGEVFEFQTADPIETDDLNEYLINVSKQIAIKQNGKAANIKTLPDVVNYEFVKDYLDELDALPIGIDTETLEVYRHNFLSKKFNIITSEDFDLIVPFIKSIADLITVKKETLKVIIFDGEKCFDKFKDNVAYVDENYEASLLSFNSFLDKVSDKTKKTLVIFIGLNKILNSSSNLDEIIGVIFDKISKIEKINVLFADDVKTVNTYQREKNISNYIDTSSAIFIGNGISNQFLIKVKKITRDMRTEIPDNYAYVINKGRATKIKLIELLND